MPRNRLTEYALADHTRARYDFTSASHTSFNTTSTLTLNVDPQFYKYGSSSLRVAATGANPLLAYGDATAMTNVFGAPTVDLSQVPDIGLTLYSDTAGYWQVQLMFCSDAPGTFTNYFTLTLGHGGGGGRWMHYHCRRDGSGGGGGGTGLTTTGAPTWTNIQQFRIQLICASGIVWYLDRLWLNFRSRPQLLICFDDGLGTNMTNVRPELNSRGLKGTFFVIPDYVGVLGGYNTVADLTTLQSDGHLIAGHHQTNLTTLSLADAKTELGKVVSWIKDNGYGAGAPYFAWPNGANNATLQQYARDAGIVLAAGYNDVYIPPTLDQRFASPDGGLGDFQRIAVNNATHASGAALLTEIDSKCIALGRAVSVGLHGVGAGQGDDWALARFQEFLTGVKARVDQGLLDVVTYRQAHQRWTQVRV